MHLGGTRQRPIEVSELIKSIVRDISSRSSMDAERVTSSVMRTGEIWSLLVSINAVILRIELQYKIDERGSPWRTPLLDKIVESSAKRRVAGWP